MRWGTYMYPVTSKSPSNDKVEPSKVKLASASNSLVLEATVTSSFSVASLITAPPASPVSPFAPAAPVSPVSPFAPASPVYPV